MSEANEPQMGLQRIFVKDLSLEVPNPKVFTQEWDADSEVNVATTSEPLDEHNVLVTLSVTVTTKNGDDVAYVAEVHQSGIFLLENIPDEHLQGILGAYCPSVLLPYAREAISDMVTKASFPQFLLSPINFEAALAEAEVQQSTVS